MNESNNLNSQFNNNQANNSTRPVTNKFFPSNLFGNDINQVNSSTTKEADSQFIKKTTWGVGNNTKTNNNSTNQQSPEVLDLFDEGIETLMDDVNATTYTANTPNMPTSNPINSISAPINNSNIPNMRVNQPNLSNQPIQPNQPMMVTMNGLIVRHLVWVV